MKPTLGEPYLAAARTSAHTHLQIPSVLSFVGGGKVRGHIFGSACRVLATALVGDLASAKMRDASRHLMWLGILRMDVGAWGCVEAMGVASSRNDASLQASDARACQVSSGLLTPPLRWLAILPPYCPPQSYDKV